MTDTTALSPEQAARAEALRVAAGLLRTGNPLAGALAEYRTPSDLTDLAEYIITGADPLAAYRIAPDEAPPVRPTFVEASAPGEGTP